MDRADEGSEYGTPTAGSLFSTPASTPHRVTYRMNPVKLVRQNVPLKLQASQYSSQSVFPDRDSLNSNGTMNPMRTKRIKCVIQPTSSYGDCVEAHPSVSPRPSTHSLSANIDCPNEVLNLVAFSDCLTPSKISSKGTGQQCPRNPGGDAESANNIVDDALSVPQTSGTGAGAETTVPLRRHATPPFELADFNAELPEILRSVAAVEREVASIDRLIKNRLEQIHEMDEATAAAAATTTTKDVTQQPDAVDKSKKDEKRKAPAKKALASKGNTDANATQGCEKKKFYDPQDIRKYMMKKKNERRAKEKEEKCKKANEQAALKRKAEVTKSFSQRSRPGSEQVTEPKNAKASKNSRNPKTNEKSPSDKKTTATTTTTAVAKSKPHSDLRKGDNEDGVCNGHHSSELVMTRSSERRTKSRKLVECDFNDVEKTGKYFEEKFNDIVAKCVNEVNKIANLDLQNRTDGTKTTRTDFERTWSCNREEFSEATLLPPEIDVLRPAENSFNFIDALKSKINLARDTADDLIVTPLADRTRRENVLEKRRRLEKPRPQIDDVQPPIIIKPELTLADLNSPHQKNNNETYIIDGTEAVAMLDRGGETFILNTSDVKRKSPKLGRSSTLKENRRPSAMLDVSGVSSLIAIEELAPADKIITNLVNEYNEQQELKLQPHLTGSETNLGEIFNLESLKTPNMSVSLPQSWICNDNAGELCREGVTRNYADDEVIDGETSACALENVANMTSTILLAELYDQMIKSEDDKLSQILRKIQQQKEALNKHLKAEIFSLELKKNQFREKKEEEKIKALKKKQRAVLLRVTKNIMELDKMRKSVVETVDQRKTELVKQKDLAKDGRMPSRLRQQNFKPRKRTESNSAAYMISNQTVFGISTSSCTSFIMDGENMESTAVSNTKEIISRNIMEMNTESISREEIIHTNEENNVRKDTATSPVHFKPGISIRLDLDADKLLQLKNSCARLKIEAKSVDTLDSPDTSNVLALEPAPSLAVTPVKKELGNSAKKEDSGSENDVPDTGDKSKSIKIKRPLSPAVFSSSKKILHSRRQSSGSDLTLPSWNDTTTTDQSDLEIRISALQEQLTQRKLEAERLRKEEKRLRKEKLRSKEQSLIKQLEAYDQYIQRLTKLLAENRNVLREASRPQIKSSSARHKHVVPETQATASSTTSEALQSDRRYAQDADTNTEDSDEKQALRKADSGILVESEGVTEASENANTSSLAAVESPSKSETRSSAPSAPRTEISSRSRSATTDDDRLLMRQMRRDDPSSQFLQLVNDLQSEVFSMSEQLYSSDFVDDVEDTVETKSEVSEKNNTSMSIEEILTDNQSDTGKRVVSALDDETAQSVSGTVRTAIESAVAESLERVESDLSAPHDLPSLSTKDTIPSVISTADECRPPTPSPPSEKVEQSPARSDVATDVSAPPSRVPDEKSATTSELESNQVERAESISDGEFDFYNVQNISAIDSLEEDSKTLSEGQIASAPKSEPADDEEVPSAEDIIVEIRSVSSLGRVSPPPKMTETSVEEATLQPSNGAAAPPHPTVEPNEANAEVKSRALLPEPDVDANRVQVVDAPNTVEERPQTALTADYGAEETDISESLEYDGVLVESHEASSSAERVTDLDADDQAKDSMSLDDGGTESHEEDRSVGEIMAAADSSVPNILSETFITHDQDDDEEEEEEEAEDGENENDYDDEYIESVGSESPKNVPIVTSPTESSVATRVSEEDLDTKITEGQTPFLQALRREQENLFARKSESMDKIVIELMDTLMEETRQDSVVGENRRGSDSENLRTDDAKSKLEDEEKSEISEELEKNGTGTQQHQHQNFGHEWYDKLDLTEPRLREAEELRQQQMKIEQEIGELQARQNTPPYVYFREIPNKPPPPYTPPSGLARLPNSESELRGQLRPIVERVCAQLEDGVDVNDVELEDAGEGGTPNKTAHRRDVTTYRRFLFDLTKEVAQSFLDEERASTQPRLPPWEEVSSRGRRTLRPPPLSASATSERVRDAVEKRVNELFGFRSKVSREKLIIQWSRKRKTDFVDDLLIQELQEEEDEWTDYERDELFIKNEITQSLLDELIQDTVVSVQTAFQRREQYL